MPWEAQAVAQVKSKHKGTLPLRRPMEQFGWRKQRPRPGQKIDYNRQLTDGKDFWHEVVNMNLSDGMMFHLGSRDDIKLQIA